MRRFGNGRGFGRNDRCVDERVHGRRFDDMREDLQVSENSVAVSGYDREGQGFGRGIKRGCEGQRMRSGYGRTNQSFGRGMGRGCGRRAGMCRFDNI